MVDTVITFDPAPPSAGVFFGSSAFPGSQPVPDRRHLVGLEGVTRERILGWLDAAEAWRARWRGSREPAGTLAGVEICNAFFEDSTRTRVSFELAARRLGATVLNFGVAGSSISKGESLLDTLRTLVAMGFDALVLRHRSSGVAAGAAAALPVAIVNAGDGMHEHPTQALLDLLTLRDVWHGEFAGRRLAIVGDIAHSRVARSAVHGLTTLGAAVTVAGPATLMPRAAATLGCRVAETVEDALLDADAAIALRLQCERMEQGRVPSLGEYARVWGLDARRVRLMKPDAVVLHPGPMNRDVEIASDVADGARSVVFRQVENGVAVRAAVLAWCAAKEQAA